MSVEFIMDGVTNKQSEFEVDVHPDPVFLEGDGSKVYDYLTVWPCSHDRIAIKVEYPKESPVSF